MQLGENPLIRDAGVVDLRDIVAGATYKAELEGPEAVAVQRASIDEILAMFNQDYTRVTSFAAEAATLDG